MENSLKPQRIVHFPNLNGLRFIAAFAVLVHHVEQYRNMYGLSSFWGNQTVVRMGEQGVTLFFVLSGFLITYLLLSEKESFDEVSIRKFYLRRILRIWPLYFFIVFLSFVVLPRIEFFNIIGWSDGTYNNIKQKLLLFGLVTPNLALALYGIVPYLAQSWSIGSEEQFYLFWPWVIQKVKNPMLFFVGLCIGYILFKYVVIFIFYHSGATPPTTLVLLKDFLYLFRIESMFIGAIIAGLLFFQHDTILFWLISRPSQIIALLLLVSLFAWGNTFRFYGEAYSVLFGVLILNFAVSHQPIISLENAPFKFLGKISYGLYMLQSIAVVPIVKLSMLPYFAFLPAWTLHLLTAMLSLALVIALATASYYWLEKPFLRMKSSFMLIKSRP